VPGRAIVAALCAIGLTVCCGSNQGQTSSAPVTATSAPSPDRRTLKTVSLPDVSGVSPSVQKQLRDGYASLTHIMQNTSASDADLGAAYGNMGKLLMAAEFRDSAVPSFLNAQALVPTEFRWPYYLAHLYKLQGNAVESTKFFERALQLRPDDVPTLVWLGFAYLDQGRPDAAEPLLARALSREPQHVSALFGLGRAALARQEYTRAVDYLERALAIDPKEAMIRYPLAMAYRGTGDLAKAESNLRQRGGGEIRPPDPLMNEVDLILESPVAYEVRGAQALDEANWPAAIDYFRKGVELNPDEPSLRHKLGTALAMNGDGRGAFQQFDEVTRRWPKFAKAQYSLGVILASSGRYREAVDHLSAAVQSDPTYFEARLQLAEALRAMGRFADSLPVYDQAARLDPRSAETRLGYAMALAGLRRYDEARERLTEGMKLYPDRREFADALALLPPAARERRQ
jgi:tetratricopeptide (TPR) repeat protein